MTPPYTTPDKLVGIGQEEGVAASPPLSHPFGAEPVPVSGKAGIANAGHTPGPWFTGEGAHASSIYVMDQFNEYPISLAACRFGHVSRGPEECRANARLIAAAPELLEALRALRLQALQSELNSPANEWGWEALQLANTAIAKATGAA